MSEIRTPYPQDTEQNESEPHLVNASMRCMMAYATAAGGGRNTGGAK